MKRGNPYLNLNAYNFWSRSMTVAPGKIDPVIFSHLIKPLDKVSTMGSCFAQHLSNKISESGLRYFVPEARLEHMTLEEGRRKNYGIFSARYGNIYTAKQALQLFDRAFGVFQPEEDAWKKGSAYIDPFRPQIEPEGFNSKEQLIEDRKKHLFNVQRVFLESDWLIFTLGLTEAWRSKKDGAIFSMAPGVYGGSFDEDKYESVNFSVNETISDLNDLVNKINKINKNIKIILTVSPVPLIATFEDRHVLVSSVASKSILRVAADELERKNENVIYFPSYEIITSPANGGRYYEDDLRQVSDLGVKHVMRIFSKHYIDEMAPMTQLTSELASSGNSDNNSGGGAAIVCDEEDIERSIKNYGF